MFDTIAIWEITWRTIYISLLGTVLASLASIPLAYLVSLRAFWGRSALIAFIQALMALPPVIVGLGLYLFFRPASIFGGFSWLYTPQLMILAQIVLVFPIVFSLSYARFEQLHGELAAFFSSYPKRTSIEMRVKFVEAKHALLTAGLTGFGRAIGEVGAVLIVGGNLARRTEVLTTVIVEKTGRGELSEAIWLGVILLIVAIFISAMSLWFGKKVS